MASTAEAAVVRDSSHGLRRELGVPSLVLTQILFIVGSGWIGNAATVGSAHAALWIAAAVLFFLPLAMLVASLARLLPLEGGVYRWADAAFGARIAYFVGWNLWAFTVTVLAVVGVGFANMLGYALDGFGGYSVDNPTHIRIATFGALGLAAIVVSLGLRVGKWVHNFGGVVHVVGMLALILVPFYALATGRLEHYRPQDVVLPAASLYTLNIFTKLAVGAFSGFEYVAIMAGECRDPANSIARSVWLSTPIIVLFFVLGTCSMVALVPAGSIDLIAPLAQTLRAGLGDGTLGLVVGTALLFVIATRSVANMCFTFAGSVRLPMVAAWQGQAPGWLGRVSRRFSSPLHSALFVSLIVAAMVVASQFGTHAQEAYQLIDNVGVLLYGIVYVVLFLIPLAGHRNIRQRFSWPVRCAAVSGLIVTVLSVVFALVPIVHVASDLLFAVKIVGVVLLFNLFGLALYWSSRT